MPYITDPDTGQQVWSGDAIPAASQSSIRSLIASLSAAVEEKAPINDPTFTGAVTFAGTVTLPALSVTNAMLAGSIDLTAKVTGALPIANGGTAGTTASAARTNLGLGTIATQAASAVAITGGTIGGITVPIYTGAGTPGSSSTLPAFCITGTRTLAGTAFHGYSDESVIVGATGIAADAYNAFDAKGVMGNGSGTYDHYSCFQARETINCTAVGLLHGYFSRPVITAGAASAVLRHFDARPYEGGGALDSDVGFYMDASSIATFKYSLWVQGAAARLVHEGPGVFGSGSYTQALASAILTLTSTTQGFLPPRMTTAQKNAINAPAEGLVVYDTSLGKLCIRVAAAWETITSA